MNFLITAPFMKTLILLITFLSATLLCASPEEAQRIKRSFELSQETWELKMKIANTAEEKQALWNAQPSPQATAAELWDILSAALPETWSIPYATFFLNLTQHLQGVDPTVTQQRKAVIESFAKHHLKQPDIGEFCIALAQSANPGSLSLLEKISSENPTKSTQGIASLGAALILKTLGDTPEIIKKRLTHLRAAIIHSADQKIGETTVADIAADELYIIRYLTKGRVPPEFSGTDTAGRIIKLSDFKGKITILLFWDASSPDTDKMIQLTNQWVTKYANHPVSIIGITHEPLQRIRELQADGSIEWNNLIDPKQEIPKLYRVQNLPAVYVLNQKNEIAYTGSPGSFVELTIDAMLSNEKPDQ